MIKIGVSACLLGIECAYNGSSKKDDFVCSLSRFFKLVEFCPEDAILSHPRESMRLIINKSGDIFVIGNKSGNDYTKEIISYANFTIDKIKEDNICGFIFAAKSPSCGVFRTKLYLENGMFSAKFTSGIFAKHILSNLKFLPHEEEKRLNDSWLKYNFLTFVYAYSDITSLSKVIKSKRELIDFHTKYKFLIMSKSIKNYKRLGRIASFENPDLDQTLSSYTAIFLETFAIKTTRKSMFNALEHMYGFLKEFLDQNEKIIFLETLLDFKKAIVPLAVVKKLFELYVEKYNVSYLKKQLIFGLYPKELSLDAYIETFK